MPGKCLFSDRWLENSSYKLWLERDADKFKAKCRVCMKAFDVSNMGESALKSHEKGKKHIHLIEKQQRNTTGDIRNLFSNSSFAAPRTATESNNSTLTVSSSAASTTAGMSGFVTRNDTLTAEIWWALKVNSSHYSYNSCTDINFLVQQMFPDSDIAKKFTCGEKKASYLSCFGIAPCFKSLLKEKVKSSKGYVLLFDESLNHELQKKQMDFHVRIWNHDKVETRYYDSQFLGHSSAEDMLQKFHSCKEDLSCRNLIQLSMDGPKVNWKFYEMVEQELKSDFSCTLLNTGSCGIHVVHGAFKDGCDAAGWTVQKTLSSLYWLFKDSPARREDYIRITGSSVFPLKFCQHRWLENVSVAERALEVWPHIVKYINAVKAKKVTDPKSKSYETISSSCCDPLMPAKIAFFSSVAKQINPFLTAFQTDKPMLPFMSISLYTLLKSLLNRFIKGELVTEATSPLKILRLKPTDKEQQLDYQKVDVGFVAQHMLKEKSGKLSERQVLQFRMECKDFLAKTASKLLDKTPINYQLVRSMSCLDPRLMASEKEGCVKKMKRVLEILVEAHRLKADECDEVIYQFGQFLDECAGNPDFEDFDPSESSLRVDTLLYEHMAGNKQLAKAWGVVELLLLMSHGQATVERGFSVNKEVAVENLSERSFIAQRIIHDHIESVGGLANVKISKQLLMASAGARQKYISYLEEQKRIKVSQENTLKRKAAMDGIDVLKKKKRQIETDIEALLKTADEFADRAEDSRNLTWVAKSNSLRRSAKEKRAVLKDIEEQLEGKLQELKNN